MGAKVYLETSVVSYLTALPSRDLVVAAHQQLTHAWWATKDAFDLYVSEAVLAEVGAGDPSAAARRLAAVGALPVLAISNEAADLAARSSKRESFPVRPSSTLCMLPRLQFTAWIFS